MNVLYNLVPRFLYFRGGVWDTCPPLKLLIDAQPGLRPFFNFFPPPSFIFFPPLVKCVNFIPNPYLAFHLYCQTRRNITENNKRLRQEIRVELMIFRPSAAHLDAFPPFKGECTRSRAFPLSPCVFLLEFSCRSREVFRSLSYLAFFHGAPRIGWDGEEICE